MSLDPSQNTLFPASGLVDIDMAAVVAESDAAGRVLNRDGAQRFDIVDINGLKDGLGSAEDDGGMSGYICLNRGSEYGLMAGK